MRRGWATTEFWTAVAVGVGSLAASLAGYLPPRYSAIASAVAVGSYAIGRGLAKGGLLGVLGQLEQLPTAPAGQQAAAPSAAARPNVPGLEAVTAPPPGAE